MASESKTKTSSFGVSGRYNHDSNDFYNKKIYTGKKNKIKVQYVEKPISPGYLDTIICSSSENMKELPDCSVHLMVTSPPYNVGKDYDDNLHLEEYFTLLKNVFTETYRVLVPGGRVAINIANVGRKPYISLNSEIIRIMNEIGFFMRGEVIWQKGASAGGSCAWGSWQSASNPVLRDTHEYIMMFSKESFKRENPDKRENTITRDEFLAYTKSVWEFNTESAKKVKHPAPFPVELPRRVIQLYSFKGDVVLDPFMGVGTTAIASLISDRHFVGYEISEEYCSLAEKRIGELKYQQTFDC
ncbi:DNA-methyltransferase [Methanohalophilus euhalobius]|jgi:site-specific DNA-methyltransferase (adenine-specific)|uniref:Type II methyltransferase n=1 Tax=Methanohalophilus euhalobius TaxID=51203 RepID=A0A314ZTN1_9EURY|nr:site-specific DNA-methyltransferase [Methanohalophilus euhalobius]PQV41754.1 site-specific DNA-methyltransferase (adenine-specific) [Methanohalophilus euhalobius]RNI10033.1 site-specific DNA-methyltransferase [Methanohalophilus euhalobius]